jgi:signal transduction histidine kinase
VLVVGRAETFDAPTEDMVHYFAQQSAAALSRAALFVQLAARNHELAEANAALVERNEVIREIVFAMSHDLRTPLAAAGMTMRQALAGAFGPVQPAYAEILRRTIASNDELQRLAETLLLVARYESGDGSTRREPVELAAMARDVVGELEPLWKDKNVAVGVVDDGAPVALGDAGELRRALVNLVANAVTFTPSGGHITVRASRAGRHASLAVEDDGYGVPPAERAQLFERLPASGTRVGAGSGLGLYIVKRIAESHGGTASYAPRDGGGSTFRLNLPPAEGAA